MELSGKLIIVTGASSGLGRAIAWHLAVEEHADVLLAARRRDRLEELQAQIRDAGGGGAWIFEVDLASPDGPAKLIAAAEMVAEQAAALRSGPAREAGPSDSHLEYAPLPFGLVNNAGVTYWGPAVSMSGGELRRIVDLNVAGTMELTRRFLQLHLGQGSVAGAPGGQRQEPRRRSPRRGIPGSRKDPAAAVLTVTSLAARLPVPYQAVYAASKHALEAFSSSLWFELHRLARTGGPRMVMTSFAPGGVATEMIERSGLRERFDLPAEGGSLMLESAERVARRAVRVWKRERRARVGGAANVLAAAAGRFLPSGVVGRVAERLYRP